MMTTRFLEYECESIFRQLFAIHTNAIIITGLKDVRRL